MSGQPRRRGVRWNRDIECFEMWCPSCDFKHEPAWWPITEEFWYVRRTLQRRRACVLEDERVKQRDRKADAREAYVRANPA